MGRYDKIRVYYNNQWQQPKVIQVYNGSKFISMGNNESYNKQHMYVYTNSSTRKRATLEREDYSIAGESYSYGDLQLLPLSNAGWNPRGSNAADHIISGCIRKTTNGAVTVFDSGNSTGTCRLKITWNADGTLSLYLNSAYYSGAATTTTTSNAVGANQWVYFQVFAAKGSYNYTITWNGVNTTGKSYNTWAISNATNKIGSDNLQWKDTLTVQLGRYVYQNGDVTYSSRWVVNMNTRVATVGSITNNLKITNTSSTGTRWV